MQESIAVHYFAVLPASDGDYNASGDLDGDDIDLMSSDLRLEKPSRVFDVNGDGLAASDDRSLMITQLLDTYFGDSNLDGEFNR